MELKSLAEKLKKLKSAALFCHVSPDGDTVGAALALFFSLKKAGAEADLYCTDKIPDKFSFLEGADKFSSLPLEREYEAYIAIDAADISRLGQYEKDFKTKKTTFNIDHHISNNFFAKNNYVKNCAANSENIYEILTAGNFEIDKTVAECLLTGIVTDTGNFKHKNVTPETLFIAGKLLEKGADLNKIVYNTMVKQSKERAKLFIKVMNGIRYLLDDKLGVVTVRLKDIEEAGARQEDTEGFIDFLMGIDNVKVGVCIMETEKDKYKISFRSKGTDVNAVAGVFGGGGHKLASGCRLFGNIEEIIDKIRYAVKQHLPE
ncbi:MAG: bifunctional oligoribonuclease/PAP phosphatase NrnA [Clostridia bacterium]|nr:bifunctional oligoribonuclease/PAP phosphatase NrnA [Clostridia bacterium]